MVSGTHQWYQVTILTFCIIRRYFLLLLAIIQRAPPDTMDNKKTPIDVVLHYGFYSIFSAIMF